MDKSLKYYIISLASFGILACSQTQTKTIEENTISSSNNALVLDSVNLNLMGIKLIQAEHKVIYPIIYASGVVAPKPNYDAALTSRVTGLVDNIFVLEGSNVSKGQPIMSISSTEYIQLQQDYMQAVSDANFYQKEYERQSTLRSSNVGSLSEFQLIESKYQNAISIEKTLRAKLELQGLNPDDLKDPLKAEIKKDKILRAPISGFIHNMTARVGMRAEPSDVLAEIIDLSELRANIFCFEKDLAYIQEGQPIEIQFINKNIPPVKGKIEYVSRTIDKETRAIIMNCSFKAPKGFLVLPEMSISAKIQGLNAGTIKPTLPLTAIHEEEDRTFVYYTNSQNNKSIEIFKTRVTLGQSDGNTVEINFLENIPPNARFAASNVSTLDAEFEKQQIE